MIWNVLASRGPFSTVSEAARGEQDVDWSAGEGAEQEACTLCFAASEAAEFLSMVPEVQAKVSAFDGEFSGMPFIAVLTSSSYQAARGKAEEIFGEVELPVRGQSFVLKTARRSEGEAYGYLVLGSDRAGALYGTYELLHQLGFAHTKLTYRHDQAKKTHEGIPIATK